MAQTIAMMKRTEQAAEAQGRDPWLTQLAASLGAKDEVVAQFHALMHEQNLPVDPGRLFMDAQYAYLHFALAHSSSNEQLRQLALALFEGYQRLENRRKNLCSGLTLH